jgi:cyclophilin family peptidyl-prolyl cis-trans isomerase
MGLVRVMRMRILIAAVAVLFTSQAAMAQGGGRGGGGQPQQQRRPQEPQPSTPPIFVLPATPTMAAVAPALTPENTWVLDLSDGGRVSIQLRPDQAPNHVERIRTLTRQGFYNGLAFHRVIEGFMAQGGDPTGTGTGQSDLPDLNAEFNALPHLRGAVAMARAENPNSANSQFYIMFVPRLSMDHNYTVFGRVVAGMEFVDRAQRGQPPATPTRIVRASIGSDNAPRPTAEEIAAVARAAPSAPVPLRALNVDSLTGAVPVQAAPPASTTPPGATPTPQN